MISAMTAQIAEIKNIAKHRSISLSTRASVALSKLLPNGETAKNRTPLTRIAESSEPLIEGVLPDIPELPNFHRDTSQAEEQGNCAGNGESRENRDREPLESRM